MASHEMGVDRVGRLVSLAAPKGSDLEEGARNMWRGQSALPLRIAGPKIWDATFAYVTRHRLTAEEDRTRQASVN